MKAISKSKIIEKNSGGGSSGSVTALATRVTTLENNERKVTYYTEINSASGTITPPTNATILLNQYPGGVDALVSTISSSQPTGNLPVTSAGVAVDVSSFDALGNYTLTGTPTSFPVALIYVFKIKDVYWSNITLDPNVLYDEPSKNEFIDSTFTIKDNVDTSKKLQFQVSGVTTNTTRTLTIPDASGTIPLGTGANTRVATWSGTNTISSDANFLYNGSYLSVNNASSGAFFVGSRAGTDRLYLGSDGGSTYLTTGVTGISMDFWVNGNLGTLAARFTSTGVAIFGGGTSTADGGLLSVQKNQNAGTSATVINTTSGTGAFASLIASNASGIGTNVSLSAFSAGYSTSGIFVAGTGVVNSSLTGGLNIGTSASTQTSFWTNNTERARFLSSGEFVVGNTTAGALAEYIGFTKNQNARTRIAAYNTTSGTGAAVQYDMRNNNGIQASFGLHSSGFTTSGALIADGAFLYGDGSGGVTITAAHASGVVGIYTAGTAAANLRAKIDQNGNVILNATGSALATSATNGFTYIATCAGTPTGVPATLPTGALPMIIDSTNNKMYIYSGGAWVALN